MPAGKRPRGTSVASTSVHLPTTTVLYRDRMSQVSLEYMRRDYDEYCWMQTGPDKAIREVGADYVSLEGLFKQAL